MLKPFLELIKRHEFVCLDTETTGIRNAQVVQIAIVNAFGKVLIDTYIKPSVPIPAEATRIHGIRDIDVHGAPNWFDIAPRVRDILDGRPVVIYNAAYDTGVMTFSDSCWGMLETNWSRDTNTFCAMHAYAQYRGIWNHQRGGYRWHKLSDACNFMGIPFSDRHTALGDAEATRRLVLAMADRPESGRE